VSIWAASALCLFLCEVAVPGGGTTVADEDRERLDQLVKDRRWMQAYEFAAELSKRRPDDPIPLYFQGVAGFQLGEKVAALQAFRSAEKLGLDTAWLHEALGLAYYDANQFVLFQQQMQRALKANPAHHAAYFHLGRYHESVRNDFEAAIREFDRALAIAPRNAKSLYFKGYCLEMQRKLIEARRCFEAAADAAGAGLERFSLPFRGMARLLNEDEAEKALPWALQAVDVEPGDAENHLMLGQVYRRLGQTESAVKSLRESTRLAPDNDSARFMLYQAYRELGDEEAARAELAVFKELRKAYGDQ
jgi:tetratricopeptide (TPR) repeat protein